MLTRGNSPRVRVSGESSPKRFLVFDIDGASVGAAAVDITGSESPKILFTGREELPLRDVFDPARNISEVLDRLERVSAEAAKHFAQSADRITFFLATPYVASQSRIVRTSFGAPKRIEHALLSDIVKKQIDQFIHGELAAHSAPRDEQELLEAKVMGVRLNGYDTPAPAGKSASEIELALYASMMSSSVAQRLKRATLAHFPHTPVDLHSRIFGLFHAIRAVSVDESYMIIDIRADVTDMAIIKHGVLVDTISHPVGENTIFRSLARELGVPLALAASSLTMLSHGSAHDAEHMRVRSALEAARVDWTSGLGGILRETLEEYMLPAQMYVYASALTGPFFKEFLANAEFSNHAALTDPFRVTLVDCELFTQRVRFASKDDDVLLGSLALASDPLCTPIFSW